MKTCFLENIKKLLYGIMSVVFIVFGNAHAARVNPDLVCNQRSNNSPLNSVINVQKEILLNGCKELKKEEIGYKLPTATTCDKLSLCMDYVKDNYGINGQLQRDAGKAYIRNFINRDLQEVIDFEAMTILTENSADKMSADNECYRNFEIPVKNNGCDENLLNEGFAEYQRAAGDTQDSFGLKREMFHTEDFRYEKFSEFKARTAGQPKAKSEYLEYLKSIAVYKAEMYKKREDLFIEGFVDAVNKVKTTDDELVKDLFLKWFGANDPSISYLAKNEMLFNNGALADLIINSRKSKTKFNKENFKKEFAAFKKEKFKNHYKKDVCRERLKTYSVCYQATNIAKGEQFRRDLAGEKSTGLRERYGYLYASSPNVLSAIDDFSKKMGITKEQTESWFENEMKCSAFIPRFAGVIPDNNYEREGASNRDANYTLRTTDSVVLPNGMIKDVNSFDVANEKITKNEQDIDKTVRADGNYQNTVTPNYANYTNSISEPIEGNNKLPEIKKKDQKSSATKEASSSNVAERDYQKDGVDRFESLENRLADAQKKLAQYEKNKNNPSSDSASMDVNNELISELRNQVKDLKSEIKDSRSAASNKGVSNTQTHSNEYIRSSADSSGSRAVASAAQSSAQAGAQATSAAGAISVGVGSSSAEGSRALLTAQSASSAGDSKALSILQNKNIAVVSMDGIGKDKIQDTIYSKITELKGSSFYIEEEGILKEVIVEYVDGKMVLDKDGKPVYKIVSIGKAQRKIANAKDEKNRISTQADLRKKQEEEIKRQKQRAEYEKLKGLTRKVIKD